jgi:hypothetical protein
MSKMQETGLPLDDELDFYASRLAASTGTTGSGAVVYGNSPSISTPIITDSDGGANGTSADVLRGWDGTRMQWADARGILDRLKNGPAGLSDFNLAWWEARFDGYTDGAAVGTMTDRSAAGSNWTQGVAGNKPVARLTGTAGFPLPNGHPYVEFDGTDDYCTRAANITDTSVTILAVMRKRAAGAGYDTCIRLDQVQCLSRRSGGDTWGMFANVDIDSTETMGTTWKLYTWIHADYNDIDMGSNGGLIAYTTGTGLAGSTGATEVGSQSSAGQAANVDIAAFAIADTATLSGDKLAAAQAYFRSVYFL